MSAVGATVQKVDVDLLDYNTDRPITTLDGKPFTGIATEHFAHGMQYIEQHYKGGLLHGVTQVWNGQQMLIERTSYGYGCKHGPYQKWGPEGGLIESGCHERGMLVERNERNPEGILQRTYFIEPDSPEAALLATLRQFEVPEEYQ